MINFQTSPRCKNFFKEFFFFLNQSSIRSYLSLSITLSEFLSFPNVIRHIPDFWTFFLLVDWCCERKYYMRVCWASRPVESKREIHFFYSYKNKYSFPLLEILEKILHMQFIYYSETKPFLISKSSEGSGSPAWLLRFKDFLFLRRTPLTGKTPREECSDSTE